MHSCICFWECVSLKCVWTCIRLPFVFLPFWFFYSFVLRGREWSGALHLDRRAHRKGDVGLGSSSDLSILRSRPRPLAHANALNRLVATWRGCGREVSPGWWLCAIRSRPEGQGFSHHCYTALAASIPRHPPNTPSNTPLTHPQTHPCCSMTS